MRDVLIRKEYPWLAEAKRLREEGMFYEDIAEKLGIGTMTVWRALNPQKSDRCIIRSSFRKLSDLEKGLLVGLIEGEGTVGIYKHQDPKKKSGFVLCPYVDIANTDLTILEAINRILSRSYKMIYVYPKSKTHKGRKPVYYIAIRNVRDVLSLLKQLELHFISEKMKRRCALVIKYCESRLRRRMSFKTHDSWAYTEEELKLWEECKKIAGSHKGESV